MKWWLLGTILLAHASIANANGWHAWRGPHGRNIADEGQNLPERFDSQRHLLWKTRLPGSGHSSPIVVNDHVFLGTSDHEKETQSVICLSLKTGQVVWQREVNQGGLPEIYVTNTHASSTLASNGTELFALFENRQRLQLVKLSLDGEILDDITASPFTPKRYRFGSGMSPLLYESMVIVAAEFEKGALLAFDQHTLQEIWRNPRENVSYSSPIVANIGGRDQLFMTGNELIQSYDPKTGELLWSVPGATEATCGTVCWDDEIIVGSGGFPDADTTAVRVTENGAEVLWKHPVQCYEQSLLAFDGYVYAVNEAGIAYCWRAEDGKQMWRARLCAETSASPVLADGVIYQVDEKGKLVVFKANPKKFEKVFETVLGGSAYATPTICQGRFLCRVADETDEGRVETLYCFGAE
ncbi:PQQ-binding-like beta-propeller repeat protein [Planctomicrobium sp. SH668]|uniref:PQQ-binding-like beta-propeller repeat protein n=1 Tax=Planctomicrobium sp. SH668 TaxID=3448126 RepID=UPI003F5C0B2A